MNSYGMTLRTKTALLIGASGLIGGHLLSILLASNQYCKVIIWVRNSIHLEHPKLVERIVNFDHLPSIEETLSIDDVFCCLGTTIKKAKTKEAFKKVDVDYPLELARLVEKKAISRFLIVSSMGADPNSKVFYSRTKGLLEEKLISMNLNSLCIFRPSLLLGKRKEMRLGEKIGAMVAKGISFVFIGGLKKYKPIDASDVAVGMFKAAQKEEAGVKIYLSNQIGEI